MRERTLVGLSEIHFGHIKAYVMSPLLSDFKAIVGHIPYAIEYAPKE
jgi:hypothetical protein